MNKKKNGLPLSWKIIIALAVCLVVGLLVYRVGHAADVYTQGYYRQNGTYVQPYHRSAPDNNQYNNYGTQGNYNPYTGQQGSVQPQPYYTQPAYPAYPTNRGNSSIGTYPR